MNSLERRKKRYIRRQEKRLRNKQTLQQQIGSFNDAFMFYWLFVYGLRCCKGVRWKASVQRFELRLLSGLYKTLIRLRGGTWVPRKASHFLLFDAGKLRQIDSVNIYTRAVQCTLCNRVIQPIIDTVAPNSGFASRKGLGTAAAIKAFQHDLANTEKSYLFSFDFSSFFASILHEPVKQLLFSYIYDEDLQRLILLLFTLFGSRGLQLGSHFSQSCAVLLGAMLDNYAAGQLHIAAYGRYSDDGYALIDADECQAAISAYEKKIAYFGLSFNVRKTLVTDVSIPHVYLKKCFIATDNKTQILPPVRSMSKLHRKLNKLFKMYDKGVMPIEQSVLAYNSWVGSTRKYKSYKQRIIMLKYIKSMLEERKVNYEVKQHYMLGIL